MFEHVCLGFTAIIADERSRKAEPLAAGLVHGAKLYLAVCQDLFRDILGLAGLNVELAFENVDGPERTYFRLVTINCCKEISTSFLDKFFNFFHVFLLWVKG